MTMTLQPNTDFIDLADKSIVKFTTEFNIIFQYKDTYDVPQETYSDIQSAINSMREYMQEDKEIVSSELWLQTTGWTEDGSCDTVGDSLLSVLFREDL